MARLILSTAITLIALHVFAITAKANGALDRRLKQSTVWIVCPDGSSGSGVLVDTERRLVVTNAHVVGSNRYVAVFAPVHDTTNEIWERSSYFRGTQQLANIGYATTGEVIAHSSTKDLAVVRLTSRLRGLRAIDLASNDPDVGDVVHRVGNGSGRPLFTYGLGRTQFIGFRAFTYRSGERISARVIDLSGHVYFGDSGGPVVGDSGELVGVISGGDGATAIAICRTEVRKLLDTVNSKRVISIHNDSGTTVHFSVRTNPNEDWQTITLGANRHHIWWGDMSNVEVKFDWSFAAGYQGADYSLTTHRSLLGDGVSAKPDQGKQYSFQRVVGGVNLFEK